jgi:pimeloyl-ACP methyl ester carboxylesterase
MFRSAGFDRNVRRDGGPGAVFHVFSYDWRRDLVRSARRLGQYLDDLARARGDESARFNILGHSMGGLVARYFLRFGGAEPGGPVTWEGARRIARLILVGSPSGGSIHALDALLNGHTVGMSRTTLAASVVESMPSIYEMLPPREAQPLVEPGGAPSGEDLHDPETWARFGWGPWNPEASRPDRAGDRAFVSELLVKGRAFHEALNRRPERLCPVPVTVMGGDCLPTLARAVAPVRPGTSARFAAESEAEGAAMHEAGDGRVTRASALGSFVESNEADPRHGGGHTPRLTAFRGSLRERPCPEFSDLFFGAADHHGVYAEPSFQSALLRRLLTPP